MPKTRKRKWAGKVGPDQFLTMNEIKNFLENLVTKTTPPRDFKEMENPFKMLGVIHETAFRLKMKVDRNYPNNEWSG